MSEHTNDGGPAFPISDSIHRDIGLTKRDWFAGLALRALLTGPDFPGVVDHCRKNRADTNAHVSFFAYEIADAMLKARERV